MDKIGFFGGSFNPVTFAHINLAKEIVSVCNLDKLVFLPIGDFYKKQDLIEFKHRYNMLKLICDKNDKLEVSDMENNQETKLYAIEIFEIIKKQYANNDIYYIMGTDNLEKIKLWKEYNDLISKYKYIILEREKDGFKNIIKNNKDIKKYEENFIIVSDEKYMNISSSNARNKVRDGRDISSIVPKEIIDYINVNNLYKT